MNASWLLTRVVICSAMLMTALPAFAEDGLEPMIRLESEIGMLFLKQGTLSIAVSAFYIHDQLSPEVQLTFEARQSCRGGEQNGQCSMTSYVSGYQDVHEMIEAIDAATAALRSGTALRRRFRMDAAPDCRPLWGEVNIAEGGTLAEFQLAEGSSTYALSTDIDQLSAFRSALQSASDLRDHLRPQIEAFNRTEPDRSKPLDDLADGTIRASDVRLTLSGRHLSRCSFLLENKSKREISYRASGQSPVDTRVSCQVPGSETPVEPGLSLVDGRFDFVKVAPGQARQFTVDRRVLFDRLPRRSDGYVGSLCLLRVELQESKEVVSKEFSP